LVGPAGAFRAGQTMRFQELPRYPMILPVRQHGMHIVIHQAAARERVTLDVRVKVDAVAEMISLVSQGFGHTLLARMGFYRELEAGRVSFARIIQPALERTLVTATVAARPLSRATEGVIQHVHVILGGLPDTVLDGKGRVGTKPVRRR
jgi:LysR family transcriptional regulator, nitrogen assimilation regulatory protein